MLIGISGRKNAGKNTVSQFLKCNADLLWGRPWHPADPLGPHLAPFRPVDAKIYSMAGPLKKFCVEILGLRPEQVYGTEEQKNTLTRYKWEDMPFYGALRDKLRKQILLEHEEMSRRGELPVFPGPATTERELEKRLPKGLMTGRQIMQVVGTEIFRCMHPDLNVEAALRQVDVGQEGVALFDDIRFENEVRAIQRAGGVVLRLTRRPYGWDSHASETALDGFTGFDAVVDNSQGTARQCCLDVVAKLIELGAVGKDRGYLLGGGHFQF